MNTEIRKPIKTRSTLYTPEMISAARYNASRYEWAKAEVTEITEKADKILKIGYDRIIELAPSAELPRSYMVNDKIGCPVCGMKNYVAGNTYRWDFNNPFKVVCPTCNTTFPSNDFERFYKSGLDEKGDFRYALADRSLLVNTLYPDRPQDWCVDDGMGMDNEKNENYVPIAHCVDHLWEQYLSYLRVLCSAYLYTGNQEYADFAIVMLSRLADVYPDMNLNYEIGAKTFVSCNGGSMGQGKIQGRIYESYDALYYSYDYDALFTAFPNLSEKALAFIRKHSPFPAEDYTHIMVKIEDRLIKEIYPNVKAANIGGNMGMHQSALAAAAKCMDSIEYSREWLDFVFQSGNGTTTGGNLNDLLIFAVDRDGFGNEASPAYNSTWLANFLKIADILDGYTIDGTDISYDMLKNPKFKKMFLGYSKLIISDKFTPHIGDIGLTGNADRYDNKYALMRAFTVYGDPVFAQALYLANNKDLSRLTTGIFSENPEEIREKVKAVIAQYGELTTPSCIFNGYGIGILKNRSEKHTSPFPVDTTATVFFGKNFGHGHRDALNLSLYSHHVDIAPDHGTPEVKNATNPHRHQVVNTTLSHNTVVVDEYSDNNQVIVGSTRHFASGDRVQLIDASSPAYEQCSLYARTVATVKITDTQTYVVDFFRVKGGAEHKYSFHTMPASAVETQGLSFVKQVDENGEYIGTYAGRDIEFATLEYNGETRYKTRGYQWYTDVNKDTAPNEKISVDWTLIDHYKAAENLLGELHLKATSLGKHQEVALVKGVPPLRHPQNPRSLPYLFLTNKGEDLESAFVTVFEPYDSADGSQITDISPLKITKDGKEIDSYLIKALKVTLKSGRVDYIVCSYDTESTYRIDGRFDFSGYFGYQSEENGKTYTWMHDAIRLGNVTATDSLKGTIVDFTKELTTENTITVKFDQANVTSAMLTGACLKAKETAPDTNPVYKIESATQNADGTFTLSIGDITLITAYSAPDDRSSDYLYNVSEGQSFSIAQSFSCNQ